ncbi:MULTISPECIES: SIS domain-containing protein [unclassified Rhizobium]|uniref:SIS domain-containing protein n=1 Tax=unclassified Rhizobium TaxID=2613769 RepID=UPI00161A9787|nr:MULTISPECIES: SIS domain-containing protein [unclassified Rhizobium]MBB3289107.1 glucosamine--fructose-6-phosphate aminotransferase (isomerizing) [Rhizobium sp. BK252]MBB3403849.1 glucosamine--fructose-6-phosphate aminotransferase (isomerizing) [Rhizobium sp. BK289]MBB3416482.1 glucosamine--fructose-6-phosphate aminotransferase (isomerizing) [Rhizobium sp. BK284]MBB3484312.1 glucosamine--fructose-6-phosphate aminotransferase (isomerizing) [Rhizobium sp. BK347]
MDFLPDFAHIPDTVLELAQRPLPHKILEIAGAKISRVRLVGMGGSYNAATAAAEHFLKLGIDARSELASHLLHTSVETVASDELVVLISFSGTSIETIRAAEALQKGSRPRLVCITNADSGPLTDLCDGTILQGLSDTTHKPFGPWTATYLSLVRLAHVMAGRRFEISGDLKEECKRLLSTASSIKDLQPVMPNYIEFFGRGSLAATATQATLIAREIARVPASDWDSSTYRHGPIEAISPTQLSVVFAAREGLQAGLDASFAKALKGIVKNVLVIGPDDSDLPIRVSDIFLPLISLFLPAILSYAWSEQAGLIAGEFRYTSHSITDEEVLTNDH